MLVARYEPLLRSVCWSPPLGLEPTICARRRCSDCWRPAASSRRARSRRSRARRSAGGCSGLGSGPGRPARACSTKRSARRGRRRAARASKVRDPAVAILVREQLRMFVRELPEAVELACQPDVSHVHAPVVIGRALRVIRKGGTVATAAAAVGVGEAAVYGVGEPAARGSGGSAQPASPRCRTGVTRTRHAERAGGVTVAPSPVLVELAERAARPDFETLQKRAALVRVLRAAGPAQRARRDVRRRTGGGARPGRRLTQPDGVLRKACGNRREAVCPACAERYRQDAYHLIAAGLRGGKGVPTRSPITRWSSRRSPRRRSAPCTRAPIGPDGQPRRCRPRRDAPVCPHGNLAQLHPRSTPRAILAWASRSVASASTTTARCSWNNLLGELWRRTTIYLPRALARLAGMTQKQLSAQVRVAYVKVAEYQQRGLVHLHVVIRLDRAMPDYRADDAAPARAALHARAARGRAPRRRRRGDRSRSRPRSAAATFAGARSSTSSTSGGPRARSGALRRLPGEVRDQGDRAGRRRAPSRDRARGRPVPVREHVKTYLRPAFALDPPRSNSRRAGPPAPPAIDVETDWNPPALAIRLQRAMSTNEALRVRRHDDATHLGRVVRLLTSSVERRDTTLVVELDTGAGVHLADVASIGPAQRPARRRDRRAPRLAAARTRSGTAGTA